MATKTFKAKNNLDLIVKNTKTFIIFEMSEPNDDINHKYVFNFIFEEEVFKLLIEYIKDVANNTWSDFTPKEATSLSTDYFEYYDRKFDSNGYLTILNNGLKIERPSNESLKLYQFNKGRLQSFIYDINLSLK